jgi:magnesium chelatase family protein
MAIGILAATGQIDTQLLDKYIIIGELALDGKLRPVPGALSIALDAGKKKFKGIILPPDNADEGAIADCVDIIAVDSLVRAVEFLEGAQKSNRVKSIWAIFFPITASTRWIFRMSKGRNMPNEH